ncbi:homeobox protein CDX-4-like isoform X1 [Emydura macquarii macquarii]|uniref:homeobox protein CDX-4-like isoform X1 n=1 Tax=Emydura macquarii macquarii TaxID=1129001 RepID=UPI003529E555
MYVSYFLDKETSMYPGSVRCNNNLPVQNFVSTPSYSDYMGYHHVPSMDNHGQSSGAWGSYYGTQREDWNTYGPGPSSTVTAAQMNGSSPGQVSYSSTDYSSLNPDGSGVLPSVDTINAEQISPNSQRHSSYEWMRKTQSTTAGIEGTQHPIGSSPRGIQHPTSLGLYFAGKTRTKEKYRVVYTDHQRLELEKEFHCNRYITIRRKSELAANLGLSERQVKIWFQNRRAKERKMIKKKISQFDGSGGSVQSDSGSVSPAEISNSLFPPPHAINGLQPIEIQQVIVSE